MPLNAGHGTLITVGSGQTLDISAGRTSSGIVVLSGGCLNLLSGDIFPGDARLEIRLDPSGLGYRLPPPAGIAAAAA